MSPRAYAAACALAADPSATPNERQQARERCAEYEAKHGKPASNLRPWWTLKIGRHGLWLGNTAEFRAAVKALRDGRKQRAYVFEWQTVKDVQDGRVDWHDFPTSEPWWPSRKMTGYATVIGADERVVEWGPAIMKTPRHPRRGSQPPPAVKRGAPRRRTRLGSGQLPGCRRVRQP